MAKENVLKSFLMSIGFDIDETQWRKFDQFWTQTSKQLSELASTAAIAAAEIAGSVAAISSEMTDLYYAAQRSGTSAGGLKAFQFGAKQIGLTADQATQSLVGLKDALRESPGLQGLLKSWGIDPNQDTTKTFEQIMKVTSKMPTAIGLQYAQQFGIGKDVFMRYQQNPKAFQAGMARQLKMAKDLGISVDEIAKRSVELDRRWGTFKEEVELIVMQMADKFLPLLIKALDLVLKIAEGFNKINKKTNGWAGTLLGIIASLKLAGVLSGITSKLGGTFGGGGAAAAAEGGTAGAAEGGAAAAGGAVLLPLLVVTAILAGLAWMTMHPEQVRAAALKAWNGVKNVASSVKAEVVKAAPYIKANPGTFIKEAVRQGLNAAMPGGGQAGNSLMNAGLGLVDWIAKNEGKRLQTYKDIAGKATIGFGHLIQKGEDFKNGLTESAAKVLLSSDVAKAARGVSGLVKTHLGKNQMDALTDFAFNVGLPALKSSTLLRKINGGDMAGAANEFGRWNKVHINGKVATSDDLTRRREEEADKFRGRSMEQHTAITVHMAGNASPHEVAREIEKKQNKVNGQIIRNMVGVVDVVGAN